MPLISYEVSLKLKWDKNCVITSTENRIVNAGPPVVRHNGPTGATFAINDCKLYVPVKTLSKDDEIKLLTNLKSGFKSEIIWNKYMSEISTQPENNNLNILIDPTFTNVNRLFALAYPLGEMTIENHLFNFIYQVLWLKTIMLLLITYHFLNYL